MTLHPQHLVQDIRMIEFWWIELRYDSQFPALNSGSTKYEREWCWESPDTCNILRFLEYIPFGRVGLGSRKHGSTDQNHQNYIEIALLYIYIYCKCIFKSWKKEKAISMFWLARVREAVKTWLVMWTEQSITMEEHGKWSDIKRACYDRK